MKKHQPGDLVCFRHGETTLWAAPSTVTNYDIIIDDITGSVAFIIAISTSSPEPYNHEAFVLVNGRLGWVINFNDAEVVSR